MKTFAERIIELREKYDLEQQEFAKRIDVSKSSITRYEKGQIQPTLTVMKKIKQQFGVSLDWQAGYDTDEDLEYSKIIEECKNADVKPEKLQQIINAIK